MSATSNLITGDRFIEMLANGGDGLQSLRGSHTVIAGRVCIDGRKANLSSGKSKGQSIDLRNLTFLEGVEIENCAALVFSARAVNFLRGLSFHGCTGSYATINNCQMTRFNGYRNKFEVLWFDGVAGTSEGSDWVEHPIIDISGFTLAGRLSFCKVQARELITISERMGEHFTAPAAITDDLVWAMQLRLQGIPVHMSTEFVRKMLEAGGAQHLVQAA